MLEEQNKNSVLRESLRVREANLRKSEQEVDSLGFRNKQLERRVAALQENLEQELKKVTTKGQKSKTTNDSIFTATDSKMITEELQKKITENAHLVTLLEDKNAEVSQCQLRLDGLNRELQQQAATEQKLRKEIETLALRNTELEAKISEAASTVMLWLIQSGVGFTFVLYPFQIGSEDGLSVSADIDNHYSNHFSSNSSQATGAAASATNHNNNTGNNNHHCDDRIVFLEKELGHWRAQYEMLKIEATSHREELARKNEPSQEAADKYVL